MPSYSNHKETHLRDTCLDQVITMNKPNTQTACKTHEDAPHISVKFMGDKNS